MKGYLYMKYFVLDIICKYIESIFLRLIFIVIIMSVCVIVFNLWFFIDLICYEILNFI